MTGGRRWCFADQLGPHFRDGDDQPVLLVEARSVLRRRRFHRAKAHLVLSALRHRAAELGDRCVYYRAETYGEALDRYAREHAEPLSVCAPTSYAARGLVRTRADVQVLASRGFATDEETFAAWAGGQRHTRMEAFYRDARRRLGVLLDDTGEPAGGQWNHDHDNREPPPRGARVLADAVDVAEPWWPQEDEVDAQVREDLDRWERAGEVSFVGRDGPRRFAATRAEALQVLERFVGGRLATFGPHEDAILTADWTMSHSLLSAPMNLGLLHPMEAVRAAEQAWRDGRAPIASVEGYVRQLIGWRDYVWHTYWHQGPTYRRRNALRAHEPVPDWLWDLDADEVRARCLATTLAQVRDHGWVHHIPRLMVLGNWALQRGVDPDELTAWFHTSFVDGYEWVMVANVVGMSQHADGGLMATKPYASGGAYINRMSDFCGDCGYDPRSRLGDDACPFTAGYWSFLAHHRRLLSHNARMRRPLAGLDRLDGVAAVVRQEAERGTSPP